MMEGGNQKIKKIAFFILSIFFLVVSNAFAFEIAWMQVQHREYGNGRSLNRLGFGLVDKDGEYLTTDKNITEVKLLDPAKKELKLSEIKFATVEEIFGSYDSLKSQWYYSETWEFDSWFRAKILDSLNPGIYWLKVATADGKTAERTFAFNKQGALPIIDSSSFQVNPDPYGNLIWRWNIPTELGHLSLTHKMRARAAIEIYKNEEEVGYFSIILPVHLGYVFISKDVVQRMNQKGDRFDMKISLETQDKNNRTYSKPFTIREKLPSIPTR
jgi:hypothetical protein